MGKNTAISWCHHTFNTHWGCARVSPACENCYAEAWAKRTGHGIWGKKAPRRFFTDRHWKQPLSWNRKAEKERVRCRVFCNSMSDLFEDRRDLDETRERFWNLVARTHWLDYLLLTKRPEKMVELAPNEWAERWPANVWAGTTAENQEWWDKRIPELLKVPAAVRFVSMEPLLGPVEIPLEHLAPFKDTDPMLRPAPRIHWLICGGESGGSARPMQAGWARSIRDQSVAAGVAFHFKQWGEWLPGGNDVGGPTWPHGEPERKLPNAHYIEEDDDYVYRVGKKVAGRVLDGRTWDEFPEVQPVCDGKDQVKATESK